jgi:hypothetical protein
LKENQQELYDDVACGFKACPADDISEEWEYDHGRYETCKCSILKSQEVLLPENGQLWTLIKIESTRVIKDRQMQETRYYISDEDGFSAAYFNTLVTEDTGI